MLYFLSCVNNKPRGVKFFILKKKKLGEGLHIKKKIPTFNPSTFQKLTQYQVNQSLQHSFYCFYESFNEDSFLHSFEVLILSF